MEAISSVFLMLGIEAVGAAAVSSVIKGLCATVGDTLELALTLVPVIEAMSIFLMLAGRVESMDGLCSCVVRLECETGAAVWTLGDVGGDRRVA
jgi:hypothetical protein